MRALLRILTQIALNALAFYIAVTFVKGFSISAPLLLHFGSVILLFTVLNILLRPLFKIIFGPLILLTFGAFLFIINIVLLMILDYLSASVTIQGIVAIILGAVLVSASNIGTSLIARTLRLRR